MKTLVVYAGFFGSGFCMGQAPQEAVSIRGLSQPVEIIKDVWGISHIYAQNQNDLFFGQGFNVARDRLFQLEMWRRQASGTMAEILGQKAVRNDMGARLFKFRGDIEREMNYLQLMVDGLVNAIRKYGLRRSLVLFKEMYQAKNQNAIVIRRQ